MGEERKTRGRIGLDEASNYTFCASREFGYKRPWHAISLLILFSIDSPFAEYFVKVFIFFDCDFPGEMAKTAPLMLCTFLLLGTLTLIQVIILDHSQVFRCNWIAF